MTNHHTQMGRDMLSYLSVRSKAVLDRNLFHRVESLDPFPNILCDSVGPVAIFWLIPHLLLFTDSFSLYELPRSIVETLSFSRQNMNLDHSWYHAGCFIGHFSVSAIGVHLYNTQFPLLIVFFSPSGHTGTAYNRIELTTLETGRRRRSWDTYIRQRSRQQCASFICSRCCWVSGQSLRWNA